MEKTTWKVLAIVFFIIALLETSLFVWAYVEIDREEEMNLLCSYDICNLYEESFYEGNVCTCYNWDEDNRVYEQMKTEILR